MSVLCILETSIIFLIVAEAPPSYREIFGASKHIEIEPSKQTAEVRRWRRTQRSHTVSRSESAGSTSSANGPFGCFSHLRSRSKGHAHSSVE